MSKSSAGKQAGGAAGASGARKGDRAMTATESPIAFQLLIAGVFFAGTASLVYEVVWIRQLGLSLGSTAVAFSVMLSAFLGGLALGSWYMGRRADGDAQPFKTFMFVEIGAAVLGILAVPVLAVVGRAYVLVALAVPDIPALSLGLRSVVALLVMLAPATLFGMTFPLATVAGGRLVGSQTSAGGVAAASSFGSAFGAVLAGLWLEPAFGLFASAAIGACLNLLAAGAALAVHRQSSPVAVPAEA